ncbi:Enamine deaminase RidA [Geosmithia morbida]|uniref:Enamine deaminase RidA n=1 Tax=Geosmithia morbida TaxID=1094350 RepID=A0A9P4YYL9_9HYPO|nr:Enamine deaminase RidA [Geosmithia morbida]KAF4124179.1 Enamine deaminase RidA [Geosmithia morbida]
MPSATSTSNLRNVGDKGREQIYRDNSHHVLVNNEALAAMKRVLNREPTWACIGVRRLGDDDMRVEIEVVAHNSA